MPIYEYKCTACEHEFEALQKINENPLQTCQSCNQDALKKKVSATAFRLSGSGWYETDFKSNNKKNLAGDTDKAQKDKDKSGESKATDKTSTAEGGKEKTSTSKNTESAKADSKKTSTGEKTGKSGSD